MTRATIDTRGAAYLCDRPEAQFARWARRHGAHPIRVRDGSRNTNRWQKADIARISQQSPRTRVDNAPNVR